MTEVSRTHSSDWSTTLQSGESTSSSDSERFQQLWASARVSLASYLACYLPIRTMVEDCLQEIAIISWQKAPKDRGAEEFLAYCMGCAKRVSKASIRKHRIGRLQFLSPDVAHSLADAVVSATPGEPERDHRLHALQHCLSGLDAKQRRLLEARYSDNESDSLKKEAETHQRTLDSVYKQLERIRTALRKCVSQTLSRES